MRSKSYAPLKCLVAIRGAFDQAKFDAVPAGASGKDFAVGEGALAAARTGGRAGGRPAERRFTVGGSGKSVARCHHTMLAYWKFESISLQR